MLLETLMPNLLHLLVLHLPVAVSLPWSGVPSRQDRPAGALDKVIALEIASDAPELSGYGASQRMPYSAEFDGTLHVWSACPGGLRTLLRVEDATGATHVEASGVHGATPCAQVVVRPGEMWTIVVAAVEPGAGGAVELHLVASTETAESRALAALATSSLAEVQSMRRAGDNASARAGITRSIQELLASPGLEHSEEMHTALFSCGREAFALGLYSLAGQAWNASVSHRQRTQPIDGARRLRLDANRAMILTLTGDRPGGVALYEQVLALQERSLPADDPDLWHTRSGLAGELGSVGQLARARQLQEEVLEYHERTQPPDHDLVLDARHNLANTLVKLGLLAEARELQEHVLEARKRSKGPDTGDLARAYRCLGDTLIAAGDLDAARTCMEEAVRVYLDSYGPDHSSSQGARERLAKLLERQASYAAACEQLEELLAARTRARRPDSVLDATRLDLARNLFGLGDHSRARGLQEEVVANLARTLPDGALTLVAARNELAVTCKELGDLVRARELFESNLESLSRNLPDDSPELLMARTNLAATLATLRDFAAAAALEEKCIAVATSISPADDPGLQILLVNHAATLLNLGRLDEAQELGERALEVLSRTQSDRQRELVHARFSHATTLAACGDFAGARRLEEQLVNSLAGFLPDDHPTLLNVRANLIGTLTVLGQADEAREATLAFVRVLADAAQLALTLHSPREIAAVAQGREEHLSVVASRAWAYGEFQPDPLVEVELARAIELLRAPDLAVARLQERLTSDPALVELRAQVLSESRTIASLVLGGDDSSALPDAVARRDGAQRELSRALSERGGADLLVDPSAAALARACVGGRVLVAYRRYLRGTDARVTGGTSVASVPSLLAHAYESNGRVQRVELGAIEPIERAANEWRQALQRPEYARGIAAAGGASAPGALAEAGEQLRQLAFDPLLPVIGSTRRLVLVLDDVLHTVPLDALPWKEGVVGDEFTFELRSTLRELLWSDATPAGPLTLLALGGADFDTASPTSAAGPRAFVPEALASVATSLRSGGRTGFVQLEHTDEEAQGIGELFKRSLSAEGCTRLDGSSASRAAVESLVPGTRFIHLATHGWFAPEWVPSWDESGPLDGHTGLGARQNSGERARGLSPMVLCGLAFAGANSASEESVLDALVTAEEIATWDLGACELAVLSACDTNVGLRRTGIGVASLQRALHMAGARSVITSLWKVADEATKELMLDFYRRLWVEKKPKAVALWEAKGMLRAARGPAAEPLFSPRDWAGWVLSGDPD